VRKGFFADECAEAAADFDLNAAGLVAPAHGDGFDQLADG
jgi:hypothetical protein